jgi:hypothetical protein
MLTKAQQARIDRIGEIADLATAGDWEAALVAIRESGHLGRTARWQAACKSADDMIGDGSPIIHAVLQATTWLEFAAL